MHLSRFEKAVVCGVTLAGIGVMTTAALAEELGVRKKSEEESEPRSLETELQLPTMPSSVEELVRMWVSGYETVKKPLSDVFRITGQMLVAPIAMVALDATYTKYLNYTTSDLWVKSE